MTATLEATRNPYDVADAPKLILDVGGVLIPVGGGNPDPSLEWKSGSMFDGDAFLWSPSHGEFIDKMWSFGVEVYLLSGLGDNGMRILSDLYKTELDFLKTFSEEELSVGDAIIQRKDFSVKAIAGATVAPVFWVDDRATLSSADNLYVIKPDPLVGLTREQMIAILEVLEREMD